MKMLKFVSVFILFTVAMMVFFLPGLTLADDEESPVSDNTTPASDNVTPTPVLISEEPPPPEEPEPPPDTIIATTEFPKIEAIATGSFQFNVVLQYRGQTERIFDLNLNLPAGWDGYVSPQYDSIKISSIQIEPAYTSTTKNIKVTATPPSWPPVDPGEYIINFKAVSGDVVGEIDLISKITAKYLLNAAPANQTYNTKAKAGRDNIFSIVVTNVGTAPIDGITFSSDKPDGWEITYQPEKIDALQIVDPKTIDVNIKPPPKTVAGDYMITLRVSGKQASATSMDIRVTVETPTIWGWVGVGIIVVVVIGLVVIFMRFGRR
jgi:uncharacterized membrane protein